MDETRAGAEDPTELLPAVPDADPAAPASHTATPGAPTDPGSTGDAAAPAAGAGTGVAAGVDADADAGAPADVDGGAGGGGAGGGGRHALGVAAETLVFAVVNLADGDTGETGETGDPAYVRVAAGGEGLDAPVDSATPGVTAAVGAADDDLPELFVAASTVDGVRAYRGRRRQRTGAIGWLRGLGTVPWLACGVVVVGLLAALGWWAGGGRASSPALPAPLPLASVQSLGATGVAASPTGTPGRTPSPARSRSPRPSPVPSTSGAGTPSPAPHLRTRYEAEVASIGNGTPANDHAGYSGTGFVDFANAVGSFVEWRVSVQAAGSVTLVVRYANGSADNRPLDLTVNGALIQHDVAFPATGDWTRWDARSVVVNLPTGTSTVRVTATTAAGGPNVDCLDVQT